LKDWKSEMSHDKDHFPSEIHVRKTFLKTCSDQKLNTPNITQVYKYNGEIFKDKNKMD